MKAFAEKICPCGCRIIRSGPKAEKMYDDYDYAVVGVPNGQTFIEDGEEVPVLVIKALVAPVWPWWCFWRRPLSKQHADAAFALVRTMGFKPIFERARRIKKESE